MKIGIDVRPLLAQNYSGVAFYTLNLLKAIFELDQKNEYQLFYNSSKRFDLPKFNQQNVKYTDFQYPNKVFNLLIKLFNWPKIDKLIGDVDVLFCPNPNFIAWSNGCRKIITVHDLSFLYFPKFFNWKMRIWHKMIGLRKILNTADIIIAVSENTKKDVINLFQIKPEKIKVIYEGVEKKFKVLDNNDSELKRVKEKYQLPEKFILFLGTLEPRKNVESLIEAFKTLKTDVSLVIGGGRGWKTKNIYQLAQNDQRIKFIGYIDEADKIALYNLAQVFVYPSYYEGFGLPLIEAMACGCPVVAGANSSQAEVVGEAGLLVNSFNINEIAKAIDWLLTDQRLRSDLIKVGLLRAKMFDWQATAETVISILGDKKSPSR